MHNQKVKCPHCGKEYSKKGIGTHIWRVHGEGKEFDPNIGYKNGKRKSWNKGLTKETDERIKKYADTCSNRYSNGELQSWVTGLTKETDERIKDYAKKISDVINEKIKNDTWHLSFSCSRTYDYNGVKLHGMWEVAYAKYLDKNNIKWRRPTEKFQYTLNNVKRYYTPDFYLIDENMYIEIKGYPTQKDRAKWRDFPLNLTVLFGKDLYEMKIINNYKEIKEI